MAQAFALEAFLGRCSHSGALIIYAAALAGRSGALLDPITVEGAIDNITPAGYVMGFIVACGPVGIFNAEGVGERLQRITNPLPRLDEQALTEINRRKAIFLPLMAPERVDRWVAAIQRLFP